ncbi:MAG: DeoR/GlpR family DNA-binding transcription regulator [Gammaproteobacteria bacterium]|nr:DeoR/GlpR family DNA-binding transcription regulator [Gammaproteobacteria bacterium]
MRPRERQSRIADLVRSEGRVSVDDLARRFAVSPETVRRDLAVLSDDGVVHKIHGGAVPPRSTGEDPFRQRMGHNVPAKRHIAKKARALVRPGTRCSSTPAPRR